MKKCIISIFLVLLLACTPLAGLEAAAYTLPVGTELHAQSVYMVNIETGTVVFEHNPTLRTYPASITKLMTALVVLDQVPDLKQTVTVYDGVVDDLLGTGAAVAGLKAGEQVTYEQLLACLLIPSACDAANALAVAACGSIPRCVAYMNQKAQELGMKDTVYVNAHGLHDPGQYTTAIDLYALAMEVLKHPVLTELCRQYEYTMPATNVSDERSFATTNYMINPTSSWYYKRVQGLKTGYTDAAGRNLLSLAEKDGQRYITVVLGCPAETLNGYQVHHEFDDTDMLLRWAFTKLDYLSAVSADTPVDEVKVTLSATSDHVIAVPSEDFYAIVPIDAADSVLIEPHLTVTELEAPVHKGDVLGTATVTCAGEEIGTIELVAQQTLERSTFLWIKDRVLRVITSPTFIAVFVILLLAIAGFVIWNIQVNTKRRRLWNSKARKR